MHIIHANLHESAPLVKFYWVITSTIGIIIKSLTFSYSYIQSDVQKRPVPSVRFEVFDTLFCLKTEETDDGQVT